MEGFSHFAETQMAQVDFREICSSTTPKRMVNIALPCVSQIATCAVHASMFVVSQFKGCELYTVLQHEYNEYGLGVETERVPRVETERGMLGSL